MIKVTIESDTDSFSRMFPGDSFEITGNDTERCARSIGTSAGVTVPKEWVGRRCVVVGILERTQRDEPENEKKIRGVEE
jgi:hypothetical protein